MLAGRVEDDVVRLAVLREVVLQVVDDLLGSERAHEGEVLRAADGGDVGAEVLRHLHGADADRPGRAVDRDPPALLDAGGPQERDGAEPAVGEARGLLERLPLGDARDHPGLAHAHVLRVRAGADAEDAVADGELGDGGACGLDLARELEADRAALRAEEPGEEAADEILGAAKPAIAPARRRRVHADEHLVVLRDRPLDLFEPQNLGRPYRSKTTALIVALASCRSAVRT
jgi:hypothetical protein